MVTRPYLFQSIRIKPQQLLANMTNNSNIPSINPTISSNNISASPKSIHISQPIAPELYQHAFSYDNDDYKSTSMSPRHFHLGGNDNVSGTGNNNSSGNSSGSTFDYSGYNPPSLSTSNSKSGISKSKKGDRLFRNIRIHSGSLSDLHTILLTVDNEIIPFGSNHTHQCSHLVQGNMIQIPSIINKSEAGIDPHLQIDSVIAAGSATLLICVSSTS